MRMLPRVVVGGPSSASLLCAVLVTTELSMGPVCVTRSDPTHQLTDPTQPTRSGKIWTQPNTTAWCNQMLSNSVFIPVGMILLILSIFAIVDSTRPNPTRGSTQAMDNSGWVTQTGAADAHAGAGRRGWSVQCDAVVQRVTAPVL